MVLRSVVAECNNGQESILLILCASELIVAVIVLVETKPLRLFVLVDAKHKLLTLAVERLAVGHQTSPKLLKR